MINARSGGIPKVKMARVALQNSKSAAVRNTPSNAQRFPKGNDKLRPIPTAKGIPLPTCQTQSKGMSEKIPPPRP